MDSNFQFYTISGRVTDSHANPLEDITLELSRNGEIVAYCRTNGRGEYYFEESLRIGQLMRIQLSDAHDPLGLSAKDFTLRDSEEITINFLM